MGSLFHYFHSDHALVCTDSSIQQAGVHCFTVSHWFTHQTLFHTDSRTGLYWFKHSAGRSSLFHTDSRTKHCFTLIHGFEHCFTLIHAPNCNDSGIQWFTHQFIQGPLFHGFGHCFTLIHAPICTDSGIQQTWVHCFTVLNTVSHWFTHWFVPVLIQAWALFHFFEHCLTLIHTYCFTDSSTVSYWFRTDYSYAC